MAIFLTNLPYTEEGAKLELTQEQEDALLMVCKRDNEGGAYIVSFYDPQEEYTDEYVVVPIRSFYDGTETINTMDTIANVIGSSKDIKHGHSSWIDLYRQQVGSVTACCMRPFTYNPVTRNPDNFTCNKILVGGHVIKNTDAKPLNKGDKCYILPICNAHNTTKKNGSNNVGGGFFMATLKAIKAVKLRDYLKISDALKEGE